MSIQECFAITTWPRMIRATQKFDSGKIEDIHSYVRVQFDELAQTQDFRGKRIAITAGSRGISSLFDVIKATVDSLKAYGAEPFVIPAMGSHGGATAEGQKALIAEYNITEESLGVPIISSLDVELVGHTDIGIPVYVSKDALSADGIIVINRVKKHTSFRAPIESGITKMMVVGLGKHMGALTLHGAGFERMGQNIFEMGSLILRKANIICGIGIVENAYENPYEIKVIPGADILKEEPKLLTLSNKLSPRIPYEKLDIMALQYIGKDISGDGMDPNVTGRYTPLNMKPDYEEVPRITRVAAFNLTPASQGSAIGMGHLDVMHQRIKDQIDFDVTYMNALSATVTNTCKMPVVMPTEKSVLEIAAWTTRVKNPQELKICIFKDTLHLGDMYVSEALYKKELDSCNVEYVGDFFTPSFDQEGNLQIQF